MFKETYLTETFKNYIAQDVPGATVDKNPSANAGTHVQSLVSLSNKPCGPQLLSPCVAATEAWGP